ncbi:MAG: hypothetical protein IKK34_04645 [Clostridia bacterium]|nr:hypothetical protein [Clostridia bacterium]
MMFAQKEWSGVIRCAGLILPATALGMLAMVSGGVSPVIWGQQTAAFFVFACLAKLLKRAFRKIPVAMRAAALALILAATLLGVEAGGAKRWLDLGVFTVNAAMMVLPALLILISGMECPWPVMLCVMAVLSFQPDLSQLAAFSAAVLPVLWRYRERRVWSAASLLLMVLCMIWCVAAPTALEPVSYSEGVLPMLGGISVLLLAGGCLALALIPGMMAYRFCRKGETRLLSLAVYYGILLLFSFTGAYPVPFMGFGLSPFAGYWLAWMCLPEEEGRRF